MEHANAASAIEPTDMYQVLSRHLFMRQTFNFMIIHPARIRHLTNANRTGQETIREQDNRIISNRTASRNTACEAALVRTTNVAAKRNTVSLCLRRG
jgi:hypothetical protein